MKTTTKYTERAAAEYAALTDTARAIVDTYATYEKDVAAVLANLDRTTPTPIIRQLQNARRADQVARANPATAEDIADHEERHAATLDAIDEYDRISRRITAAQAERIAAAQEGESLRAERDEARATAADLAKVISRTLSERADLVQVAAAADLEEPTAAELETAARRAEENGEELTAEEIHARAKRRHRRNAVARYVRAQRGVNALNGMHTDTRAATAEEVAAWVASGKPLGAEHKQPTKGGYITLEYREQTKSRPSGYYFVNRRFTVNQWHSIEQLNESGDISGYIRTQNPYADNLAAIERLENLATAANLTDRERQWLAAFCSPTARKTAAEIRRQWQGDSMTADKEEYNARKAYAFERIGINTDTNRRQFFSRMSRRLAAAAQVEHTCQTPQEYAERDRIYWERLQSDSRRGTAKEPSRRPDLVASMSRAAAEITAAPVVKWTESNEPTEPTSGKDYRAAEVERRAAENAAHAAKRADQAAELARVRAAARAEAEAHHRTWNARPPHRMTAAEFNAVPSAARLALLDQIHAEGKRLEIVKG